MTKTKIHKKRKTRKTRKTHKTRKTRRRQRFSKKILGGGNFITRLTRRPPPGGRWIYINGQWYIDAIPDDEDITPRRHVARASARAITPPSNSTERPPPGGRFIYINGQRYIDAIPDDEDIIPRRHVERSTAIAITPPSNSTERTNDVVRTSIMPTKAEILDSREPIPTAVLADTNNDVVAASNVSLSTNPSGLSDRFIDSYIRQSPRSKLSSAREKDELKRQLQNNIYYDPNWINPFTLEVEDDPGEQFNAKAQQWTKYYDGDTNRSMYDINDPVSNPNDLAVFKREDMMKPLWLDYIPEW